MKQIETNRASSSYLYMSHQPTHHEKQAHLHLEKQPKSTTYCIRGPVEVWKKAESDQPMHASSDGWCITTSHRTTMSWTRLSFARRCI